VRLTCRYASMINDEVAAGVTVSETGRCPYCGSVPGPSGAYAAPEPDGLARAGIEPLYREVRRIREIAEAHAADDDARRIAELTRQVHELRATVARLRGPGTEGSPRWPRAGRSGNTTGDCSPRC
jgi:hypothetical protein